MDLIKVTLFLLFMFTQAVLSQPEDKSHPKNEQIESSNSVLWKISGNGLQQPSYVFGSWHLLCRNEIIFQNKVKLAISQTQQLLVQNFITYLSAEDYYDRIEVNEDINRGQPIYKLKDRKQRKKLLKLINKYLDLKVDHAKRVKPVVKRMTPMEVYFSSLHSFINDCRGMGSFDGLLYDHYQKNNAPIGSINDRKAFMESLMASGFVSPDSLIAYIEDIGNQKSMTKEMKFTYYRDENLLQLKKMYQALLENDFTEASLIDRYVFAIDVSPWVEIMSQWIKVKPTFISVNASYLLGESGVVEALRSLGYVVEPVY